MSRIFFRNIRAVLANVSLLLRIHVLILPSLFRIIFILRLPILRDSSADLHLSLCKWQYGMPVIEEELS